MNSRRFSSLPICAVLLLIFALSSWAETPRRLTVAIMPLQGRLDAEAMDVLSSNLASEVLATGKARVMERSQMEQILKEQGLEESGACDQSECAVRIGKLLTVDRIILGTVGRFGGAQTLSLRLVDVGSGEVVASVSKSCQGPVEDILTHLVPAAARELFGASAPAPTQKLPPPPDYSGKKGTLVDLRDGRKYPWVRIGGRVWMARSLAWDTSGSFCYQDKASNCSAYGKLYPWETAHLACPRGWRLPSREELDSLAAYAGPERAGTRLKDSRDWDGEDDLGFRALPGGRRYANGDYDGLAGVANFWSSTTGDDQHAYAATLYSGSPRFPVFSESRQAAFSVRCVLDP